MIIHNVRDRRFDWVGSWEVEPLVLSELRAPDIGRTVIYQDHGGAEAGTISSWSEQRLWARFSKGDTDAACDPADLWLAKAPLDGDAHR